jgi:hypothetical protein
MFSISYQMTPFVVRWKRNGEIIAESSEQGPVAIYYSYLTALQNISANSEYSLPQFSIGSLAFGTDASGRCTLVVKSGIYQVTTFSNQEDILFAAIAALGKAIRKFENREFDSAVPENISIKIPENIIMQTSSDRFSLIEYEIEGTQSVGVKSTIIIEDNKFTTENKITHFEEGNGAIDASYKAINVIVARIIPFDLTLFNLTIVTEGTDTTAIGRASVTLRDINLGKYFLGQARDRNIIVAAIKAYLDAINSYYSSEIVNSRPMF